MTGGHCRTTIGREIIVGTHCCATTTSDHISERITYGVRLTPDRISASMIYVMWREEHLWNVSVLQRVHIFILVCQTPIETEFRDSV
jgi:hypothetical protein